MTRYFDRDDDDTWNAKYDNCKCDDDIESLSDAKKIIDQFILSNPNYAMTSEDPKVRKRATELFKKRQEYKTKVEKQLKTLNSHGISNTAAIKHLPKLKQDVLEFSKLLEEISRQDICLTQLTKDLLDK